MNKEEKQDYQKQIVRNNLIELFQREEHAKTKISKECHISPSAVSRWITPKNPAIPSPEYLSIIAAHFSVSVDWILTDHSVRAETELIRTYYDAFRGLIRLIENQTLNIDAIKDPILNYLLSEYFRLINLSYVTQSRINDWFSKVQQKFNITLPDRVEPENTKKFLNTIRRDDTPLLDQYAHVAHTVSGDQVDTLQSTLNNIHNEKGSTISKTSSK